MHVAHNIDICVCVYKALEISLLLMMIAINNHHLINTWLTISRVLVVVAARINLRIWTEGKHVSITPTMSPTK